ncbi:hypothetical protein [Rhizobium sp. LjRoot254]|uniref:hypothetical protein n=1 Tax=Rhizobium sp. LjRoot254 TaxID=3342297 RepID=UPI003ECD8B5C
MEPSDDERAIRQAYAARLKITRPDEDAAAFQELLEARDLALRLGKQGRVRSSSKRPKPNATSTSSGSLDVKSAEKDGAVGLRAGGKQVTSDSVVLLTPVPELGIDGEERAVSIEALFRNVDHASTDDGLSSNWFTVFDAIEGSSFEQYRHLMRETLKRLLSDLRRSGASIPDLATWQINPASKVGSPLGRYHSILGEFERRFNFLENDRVLLEYLGHDDLRDIVNALTLASGRDSAFATQKWPDDPDFPSEVLVHMAFGHDKRMLSYYDECRREGHYQMNFSLLALVAPVIFAIHHRLNIFAYVAGGSMIGFVVARALSVNGVIHHLSPLLFIYLYGMVAIGLVFTWRRLRLLQLRNLAENARHQGRSSAWLQTNIAAWGRPNWNWLTPPLVVVILFVSVMFFGQIFESFPLEPQ